MYTQLYILYQRRPIFVIQFNYVCTYEEDVLSRDNVTRFLPPISLLQHCIQILLDP